MNQEKREMANRKFVQATVLLEKAHEIAMSGQSPGLISTDCMRFAQQLTKLTQKLQVITATLEVLSQQETQQKLNKRG